MRSSPMCESCVHLDGVEYDDEGLSTFTCAAFPEGIPRSIYWEQRVDHRRPYRGDNGIRFELAPGADPYPFDDLEFDDVPAASTRIAE